MATGYGTVAVLCGWEGNRGLASHWPFVTDSAVCSPAGLMASEGETSILPTLLLEYYDTLYL